MSGPVDQLLAELARTLRGPRATRARLLEEVREHLLDAVAEERAAGLEEEVAERAAVARFGPAQALAHALRPRRRRLLARVLTVTAGVALAGGIAFAQLADAPTLIGLQSGTPARTGVVVAGAGGMRLVPLDPRDLRTLGAGVHLSAGRSLYLGYLPGDIAFRAPDGLGLAFVSGTTLHVFGLQPLRTLGSVRIGPRQPARGPRAWSQVGGSADVVRAGAWFAGGRVAVLLQHQAPPYARRVTARTLVLVDPDRQRVVEQRRLHLRGAILASRASADRLVVLVCRDGRSRLLAIESDGRGWQAGTGVACSARRRPALALDAAGARAAVVSADGRVAVADLVGHRVRHVPQPAGRRPWQPTRGIAGVAAAWLDDRLAVSGAMELGGPGRPRAAGLGATLLDPATGATRVLSRDGSAVLVTGDRLIVSGLGRPPRRGVAGSGLTAFDASGRRLWHLERPRIVWPFVVGTRVFAPHMVKRHTQVEVYALDDGARLDSVFQRGTGMVPVTGAILPAGA